MAAQFASDRYTHLADRQGSRWSRMHGPEKPPKPAPAKAAAKAPPVAAYALKAAPSVTVQKMLRRILELRKANPKAAFHWNP